MADVAVKFRRELSILVGNVTRKSYGMPNLYIRLMFTEVTWFVQDRTSNKQPNRNSNPNFLVLASVLLISLSS